MANNYAHILAQHSTAQHSTAQHSTLSRRSSYILLIIMVMMTLPKGNAQSSYPSDFKCTPNGILDNVYDRYGNKYELKDLLVNTDRLSVNGSTLISCSSTSYFNLYFETGSGMEDATNPDHIARRAVVCKVFEDLSNFINSPLSSNGNKVNIWVRNINNVVTAPNGVIGLASGFYNLPSSASIGGIADNEIWKTIHTGTDSYLNSTIPLTVLGGSNNQSGFFYHGLIAFNFNTNNSPTINFNTNLSLSTIPTGQFDLYSALLHEVTHALGFASLIDQNGNSVFGPNYKYYSRYDQLLKTNDLSQFIISSTGCSTMYDLGFNSNLNISVLQPNTSNCLNNFTNCNNAIRFAGTSNVPVYTPNCFSSLSSLSHFEDTHFPTCNTTNPTFGNDNYFLMCNSGNSGMMRRFLRPEERNALCDIGYNVKTTFGSSTVRITPTTFGPFNYGGTACNGISVAGINDGINNAGSYTFIGNVNTNISIGGTNNILSNDVNAIGFECLQDLTATVANPTNLSATSGTIATATTLTFSSSLAGLHLLRYVPINGLQRGNITYVYVFVKPIVTNPFCAPTPSTCNLVSNGNFEQNNAYLSIASNSEFTRLCGWHNVGNSYNTYMFANTAEEAFNVPCNVYGFENDKITNNDGYVAITLTDYSPASLGQYSGIIGTTLSSNLQPNTAYQLSFDVSISDFVRYKFAKLQAFISSTSPSSFTSNLIPNSFLNTGILLASSTFLTISDGWKTVTLNFTTGSNTNGMNFLYIGGLNNFETQIGLNPFDELFGCVRYYSTNAQSSAYYIDNVSLIATGGATLNLPETICTNQSFSDLGAFLEAVPNDGFFSGTGVTFANGVYSFNATTAGSGSHIITYTYNNSLDCPITLSDTIVVSDTSNGILMDAINDDFNAMPIDGAMGGVTSSVYANDFYNGTASSSASLPNVFFSLVNPIAISGATINSMGLISVPAGTPANTYTLTYQLNVIGNCSTTDTATVVIVVSPSITPDLVAGIRANRVVKLIGLQSSNKSIISGEFTTYNYMPKNRIARLHTNLTLDNSFNSSGSTPTGSVINGMAIQADNKIIVVGGFTGFSNGSNGFGIARLDENGAIDANFNIGGVGFEGSAGNTGNIPKVCYFQPDGKILVGGDFFSYNGVNSLGIARLNQDGTIDTTFYAQALKEYYRRIITSILVQPDGKILLLGFFSSTYPGILQKNIVRLLPDGHVDASFIQGETIGTYFFGSTVEVPLIKMALQSDGKIIVVGAFTKYNGTIVKCIVRLAPTGAIDTTFNMATGVDRTINDVLIEPITNKIIIGGEFTTFGSTPVKKLIRLSENGDLDATFSIGAGTTDSGLSSNPYALNYIKVLKQQPDGKIIVGGKFLTFNGLSATHITRIFGASGVQAKSSVLEFQSEPEINTNFETNVVVYPNPSSDIFNIDLTQVEQAFDEIVVYKSIRRKSLFNNPRTKRNKFY